MPPGTAWHPPDISTHALREEGDGQGGKHADGGTYFYPRPPRGGRHTTTGETYRVTSISTHALREEGDVRLPYSSNSASRFLPTPSARRATRQTEKGHFRPDYFYPRPPRGGRLLATALIVTRPSLFLPTPSARRATSSSSQITPPSRFLPSPSARSAPGDVASLCQPLDISTHALREEGDIETEKGGNENTYFYPRPPRGGRPPADGAAP